MAQYFGQTQMSRAPNALGYLKKKEQEKKKINLFDFSDIKPTQPTQTPQMNFGQPVSQRNVTNFADYQSTLPKQQPTQKSGFSLFPTANAMEENNIPQYNPNKGRGATNLFINERQALENMVNSGIDEEQALKAITEKRKELWGDTQLSQQESNALIQMAKADVDINQAIKAVKEKRYDDATILQKIGKNVLDLAAAGPALMAEQIANVGSFIFNDDELKQQAEAIRKIRKEDFENTIGGKTGSFVTGLGETLAVGPTKLAPTMLGRTAQGAMVGGVVGGATPVLEKGKDATMGDIVTGGVFGGTIGAVATPLLEKVAIPAVAGTISKGQKYGTALLKGGTQGLSKSVSRDVTKLGQSLKKGTTIPVTNTTTRTIPTKIVERDLGFTPTERDAIIKITKKTPAQYVLEKNLAGKSKTELAEIFEKQSSDMYNGIGEKLKTIDKKVQSNYATDALNDMLEQLTSKPKYARAYSKDIEAIQGMLQRGEYTLDELNNIRRAYDKVNTGIYTAKGEVRSGLDSEIDAKIRRGINETLQKEAQKYGIDVKGMNEELRAGIQMKDALLRRLSQEERNDFIGLQDLGVSAILSGGNPITAVATIGAKKYGEQLAPGLAQKLYNLNKQNVPSRMTRGNTIITNNKSSNLNLAPSTMTNMAKQEGLKPSILSPREKALLKPNQPTNVSNKTNIETKKTGRKLLNTILPSNFKEKAQDFVEGVAEKVGAKKNIIPRTEKQVSVSDDLVSEAKKYKSFDDMINGLEKQGKISYHGTPKEFDKFDLSYMGDTGYTEGPGFYFTDSKDFAKRYTQNTPGGRVIAAYLDIKNPMTLEQRKVTNTQLKNLLNDLLKEDNDILGNYGVDIGYVGKEKALKEAIDNLNYNETDVDILSDMGNSLGIDRQRLNDLWIKNTGFDGVITDKIAGRKLEGGEKIIVAFNPNQIKDTKNLKQIYEQAHKAK